MYVNHMCAWSPGRSEDGIDLLGLESYIVYELYIVPIWLLGTNPGPMLEQQMFLTRATSLVPQYTFFVLFCLLK